MDIKLSLASIYISDICNCKCIACNVWQNKSATNLPIEKWFEVIEDLHNLGITFISFSGGEPLLRRDIIEIIEWTKEKGFLTINLCTNAMLLDEVMVWNIKNAGINSVYLSIDGIGEIHDRIKRVKGSFKKNIKALKSLSQARIPVSIATNLLEENLDDIPDIIDLAEQYEVSWVPNIINDKQYYFRGIEKDRIIPKDSKKIDNLIKIISDRLKQGNGKIMLTKESLPIIHRYLKSGGNLISGRCFIGYGSIYINAAMDVFTGCTALKSVGNLKKGKLSDIVNSENYRKQVERMNTGQCPGCTCSYMKNVVYNLKHGEKQVA